MNLADMIPTQLGVPLAFVSILTLIQIAPIKLNPWSWLARRIGRAINGEVISEVQNIKQNVTDLRHEIDEDRAVTARVRILRFCNELQLGMLHTKDSFDQVMSDITLYERFTRENPGFKNNQTEATVKYITKVYYERLEKHDFL